MNTPQQLAEMTAAKNRGEQADATWRDAAARTPGVGAPLDSNVGVPRTNDWWPRQGLGYSEQVGWAPPPHVSPRPQTADPVVAGLGLPHDPVSDLRAAGPAVRSVPAVVVDTSPPEQGDSLDVISPDIAPASTRRRGLRARLRRS